MHLIQLVNHTEHRKDCGHKGYEPTQMKKNEICLLLATQDAQQKVMPCQISTQRVDFAFASRLALLSLGT